MGTPLPRRVPWPLLLRGGTNNRRQLHPSVRLNHRYGSNRVPDPPIRDFPDLHNTGGFSCPENPISVGQATGVSHTGGSAVLVGIAASELSTRAGRGQKSRKLSMCLGPNGLCVSPRVVPVSPWLVAIIKTAPSPPSALRQISFLTGSAGSFLGPGR